MIVGIVNITTNDITGSAIITGLILLAFISFMCIISSVPSSDMYDILLIASFGLGRIVGLPTVAIAVIAVLLGVIWFIVNKRLWER